jgi:hypothetical protein
VVFGPLREPAHEAAAGVSLSDHGSGHGAIAPIGWHEIAGMAPILGLVVVIGIFPAPFLNQIRPAVARINDNVQTQLARAARDKEIASQPPLLPRGPRRGGAAPKKGGGARPRTKATANAKGNTAGAGATLKKAAAPAPETTKKTPNP